MSTERYRNIIKSKSKNHMNNMNTSAQCQLNIGPMPAHQRLTPGPKNREIFILLTFGIIR